MAQGCQVLIPDPVYFIPAKAGPPTGLSNGEAIKATVFVYNQYGWTAGGIRFAVTGGDTFYVPDTANYFGLGLSGSSSVFELSLMQTAGQGLNMYVTRGHATVFFEAAPIT